MGTQEDLLRKISKSTPSSAMQVAELAEEERVLEEKKKHEEFNSTTNHNLRTIIQKSNKLLDQSGDQIQLLKEQNENLKEQLKLAIENEKDAKKEAKHNRIFVYISTLIAFLSLTSSILIAVLK